MKKSMILLLLILVSTTLITAESDTGPEFIKKFDSSTEDVLMREVNIPSILKIPLKIVFGIGEPVTWQLLIIQFAIFFGFLIIILSAMEFVPFFEKSISKFLAAFIVTILVSISGGFSEIYLFLFNIIMTIEFIKAHSTLSIIIFILIIVLLAGLFKYFSHKIKNQIKIEQAEITGRKFAQNIEELEELNKVNQIKNGQKP
jgi:hypothetical protein